MTETETPDEQPPAGEMWIGPIGPIRILANDDPRIIARQLAEGRAAAVLTDLTTVEELVAALSHEDLYVRRGAVNRLIKEGLADAEAAAALLVTLRQDPDVIVRMDAANFFSRVDGLSGRQLEELRGAADEDEDVRDSVALALFQQGHGPNPYAGQF